MPCGRNSVLAVFVLLRVEQHPRRRYETQTDARLRMVDNYATVVFLIGLFSFLGGIVRGCFNFGDGITVHILWHVACYVAPGVMGGTRLGEDTLLAVTILIAMRNGFVGPWFAFQTRALLRRRAVAYLLPLYLVTAIIGTAIVLRYSKQPWLRVLSGGVFIACGFALAAIQLWRLRSRGDVVEESPRGDVNHSVEMTAGKNPDGSSAAGLEACAADTPAPEPRWEPSQAQVNGAFVTIAAAGICIGVVSVAGPPMIVYQLAMNVPSVAIRGVVPMVDAIVNTLRCLYVLFRGGFSPDCWAAYVAVAGGGMLGQSVGGRLFGMFRKAHEQLVVTWLLVLAGIALADLPFALLAGCAALAVVTCAAFPFVVPAPAAVDAGGATPQRVAAAVVRDGATSPKEDRRLLLNESLGAATVEADVEGAAAAPGVGSVRGPRGDPRHGLNSSSAPPPPPPLQGGEEGHPHAQ
jgi:hypothetical protein